MRVQHPRAVDGGTPPAYVDVRGERVAVNEDGSFEVPEDATAWLQTFADAHDTAVDELREEGTTEICGAEMSDGDICERPAGECPYHDEEE